MNRESLLELCEYNDYATALVLGIVACLSPEEMTRPISPSHGSVLKLLQHMFSTEAYFLAVCQGDRLETSGEDLQTLKTLQDHWIALAEERREYLVSISAEELQAQESVQIRERVFHFPRWQMVLQALLHAAHHRGELSIILSEAGHPLPTLDVIIQFARQSGQEWPWT